VDNNTLEYETEYEYVIRICYKNYVKRILLLEYIISITLSICYKNMSSEGQLRSSLTLVRLGQIAAVSEYQ
jgi:hypothetical protein